MPSGKRGRPLPSEFPCPLSVSVPVENGLCHLMKELESWPRTDGMNPRPSLASRVPVCAHGRSPQGRPGYSASWDKCVQERQ